MDLNSPDTWRWLWFVVAVLFLGGELLAAATFFFIPFAIGATVAGVIAVFGVGVTVEWTVFLIVSVVAFAGLWPLGRRLENSDREQEGVGATRWVGQEATVIREIGENGIGMVRLEREEWRAESLTGTTIRAGSAVVVTRVTGTRLVVVPLDKPLESDAANMVDDPQVESQPTDPNRTNKGAQQ